MRMQLRVKRLTPAAVLPKYAKRNDSGLDLYASVDLQIEPGESRLVQTGIAIELPAGTEAQIRPRSGLAREHAVTVLNTPGTIDEGYRGEVGVIRLGRGTRAGEELETLRQAGNHVRQEPPLAPPDSEPGGEFHHTPS